MGLAGILKNAKLGKSKKLIAKLLPVNVECPICGSTCEADLFGKHKSLEMPACPLLANQTIRLIDTDIELPGGDFLALAQARMMANFVVRRTEGERDDIVGNFKALFQMSRIGKGMPGMNSLM